MIIDQTKSLGRTLESVTTKNVRLFLFNTEMPANQAAITFDPTDPLDVFANSVAMSETVLSTTDQSSIVLKSNPEFLDQPFKGSGLDITREVPTNWLIPTGFNTNLQVQNKFDVLNLLALEGNSPRALVASSSLSSDDFLEFEFDYLADVSGLSIDLGAINTQAAFDIQYWDPTLLEGQGDWVTSTSVDTLDATRYDIEFASVNTSRMRVLFTQTGTGTPSIEYCRFFSSTTAPVTNFDTLNPASWAMMFVDLTGETMSGLVGHESPYIWFPIGNPLAPNVGTFASIEIESGVSPKLIHAEFVGAIVEDI